MTAHEYTDEQLAALESRIAGVYKDAADDVSKTVEDYFAQFEKRDAEQLKLVESGQITKDEYTQWRLTQMGRGERYQDLRNQLAERYTNANEVAVSYVNDMTPGIYSLNRNYAAYTIEEAGAGVDFNLWDESTVRRNIVENPNLMPNYPAEKALRRGIDLAYGKEQITANVTSGILQGLSPWQIADNLQAHLENMNRTSAVRTARTAFTAAENAGTQDAFEEAADMGIQMEKEWIATLDDRTREDHLDADGQVVPYDEPFKVGGDELMYPGDPSGEPEQIYNCRCTMIARVAGVDMSDMERRGSGENFEDWLENKGADEDMMETLADPEQAVEDATGEPIDYDALFEGHEFEEMSDVSLVTGAWDEEKWSELEGKNITDEQRNQIYYGSNGYINSGNSAYINSELREHAGQDPSEFLSGENLKTVNDLRDVIANNTMPQDAVVTRYMDAGAATLLGIDEQTINDLYGGQLSSASDLESALSPLIGTQITEQQFVSTSASSEGNIFTYLPVDFKFDVLEGTNAYVTSNIMETEVIFDRPTYQITGFDVIEKGQTEANGHLTIYARILP